MTNVLLVIGVLANLLNLGDFVLRPHQKQAFQRLMETITLWFEYTKPISWYKKLSERRYALAYATFCGLFLAYAFFAPGGADLLGGALAFLVDLWANTTRFQLLGFASLISTPRSDPAPAIVYAYIGLSIVAATLALIIKGPWVTEYLSGPGRIGIYFRRLIFVYVVSVCIMSLSMLGAKHFGNQYWYLPLGLPISVSLIIPIVINAVGLLMIILMVLFFAIELILKLVRAVAWRIVEYSDGAWSAIILICTVAIGLYKVFVE